MKNIYKHVVGGAIFILIGVNIMLFAKSIALSDNLLKIEKETQILQVENRELERKLYAQNSHVYLRSVAQQLGFIKKSDPMYIDSIKYAQN